MIDAGDELVRLVGPSSRLGLTPSEWRDLCVSTHHAVVPPSPEEWREAVLSTLEEPAP